MPNNPLTEELEKLVNQNTIDKVLWELTEICWEKALEAEERSKVVPEKIKLYYMNRRNKWKFLWNLLSISDHVSN